MAFIAPKQPGSRPEGNSVRAFTDGTSNSLMIVEASDAVAVEWTRPVDFEPDERNRSKVWSGCESAGSRRLSPTAACGSSPAPPTP
jgi:hypothetical protein